MCVYKLYTLLCSSTCTIKYYFFQGVDNCCMLTIFFHLQEDRKSILKALSAKLPLMGEISHSDLQVIAGRTEGFTGADLRALLYNAQLRLRRRKMGESTYCFGWSKSWAWPKKWWAGRPMVQTSSSSSSRRWLYYIIQRRPWLEIQRTEYRGSIRQGRQ